MVGALVIVVTGAMAAYAQKPADKPRVPPGVDPGGVSVAIIGNGIDYTRPQIAARLARDGEGEIIGWDFIDNDRRPYALCSRTGVSRCEDSTLLSIKENAPQSRFVIARVDPIRPQTLVDAMQLIAGTSARIVLMTDHVPRNLTERFASEAARRFPDHVVIAATPLNGADSPTNPTGEGATTPVNLVMSPRATELAGLAARELSRQPELTPAALRQNLINATSAQSQK